MNKNTHSIQRVFLEIDTHSMAMANSIKNNLTMFIEKELVPILEKEFDSIENTNNHIVQIEKLEIEINSDTDKIDVFFSNSEAKNNLKIQIESKIHKALSELKTTTKKDENRLEISTISPQDKDIKTLLYFIENGSMPWWISKGEEILFFDKIISENLNKDSFCIPFRKLIDQKYIQKRIINQFSNYEIIFFGTAFINSVIDRKTLSRNGLLKILDNESYDFKVLFWQLIFEVWTDKKYADLISFYYKNQTLFLSKKLSPELFIQSLKIFLPLDYDQEKVRKMKEDYLISEKTKLTIVPNISNKKEKESITNENEKASDLVTEKRLKNEDLINNNEDDFLEESNDFKSCYVQNAGLIILHPFIKELLKNCSVIDDNNVFTDKVLAAHILHYTATKRENDYEHTMLFEKFLCGIPVQQSIQREVKIDDKHKQHIEEMLDSVVFHWSALKNTSTAVLRSEFLQREGKLDWSESNPKLTMERKTQDLLLEKIPWNISIVKILWIEKLIYTQW